MKNSTDFSWLARFICAPTLQQAVDVAIDATTGSCELLMRGESVDPVRCRAIAEEFDHDEPVIAWAWTLLACRPGQRDRIVECAHRAAMLLACLDGPAKAECRGRIDLWREFANEHASKVDADLFAAVDMRWTASVLAKSQAGRPLAKTRTGIPTMIAVLLAPRWDKAAEIAWKETLRRGVARVEHNRTWLIELTADHEQGRNECLAMFMTCGSEHTDLSLCWRLLAADVTDTVVLKALIVDIETAVRGVDWDEYPDLLPRLRVMRNVAAGRHKGEFGSIFHLASTHRNSVGPAEPAMTPHVPVPLLLLMHDRRDAAVSWLWDVMLGDEEIDLQKDLVKTTPPSLFDAIGSVAWRGHISDIVDALFELGTQQASEFAVAWQMMLCETRSPSGFHVVLPQVQRLLDSTWMTNDNRALRQQRLDVWWAVAGERKLSSTTRPYTVDVFELAWREVHKDLRGMAGFESLRKSTERVTKKLSVKPSHAVVVLKHENADDKLPSVWKVLIDEPLPRVVARDVDRMRATLHDEYPHATAVIDSLLRDVREGQPVRLTPTILLGPAGTGKSRMVRRIAELLGGLHVTRYDCASSMDGMFSGSPRAWSNSHPSVPASAILSARSASALIMLDEISRAGTSPHNGRLWDTLIPFLERETSARYRDTGLGAELDLSHISYIATANSVEELPGPLRDRFRILKVPSPTLAHLPKLAGHVLAEIRRDDDARSHDEPLAADELAIIGKAWASERFSMRKLQRIVGATLDARDQMARRH